MSYLEIVFMVDGLNQRRMRQCVVKCIASRLLTMSHHCSWSGVFSHTKVSENAHRDSRQVIGFSENSNQISLLTVGYLHSCTDGDDVQILLFAPIEKMP